MSPTAAQMLLSQVVPILTSVISRGGIRPAPGEDAEELIADATAQAAAALDSAERRGKQVPAQSLAYYALQSMKVGRRSTSGSRCDVLGPACRLDGNVSVVSFDDGSGDESSDGEDNLALGEMLADKREDPGSAASRNLDWKDFLNVSDDRTAEILLDVAAGYPGLEMASRLNVTPPRVTQIKSRIGERLAEFWLNSPEDIMADSARDPVWKQHVRAFSETRNCRRERILANQQATAA